MVSFVLNGWTRSRRLSRGLAVAGLVTLAAWLLLAGAPAYAALQVQHDSYVATESSGASDGDGIIGPGDQFTLQEKVISAETQTLTNVNGTVTSADGSATILQGSSAYPDLQFGVSTGNTTLFQLSVPNTADCGISLPLNLGLTARQGTQNVQASIPFAVTTGAQGAYQAYNSTQVPLAIPSLGTIVSTLQVTQPGRVRGLRVRIGSLIHSYDGDLNIALVAPDGTSVPLINANLSNNGQNFINTTFDQNVSTPITSASAPYTGSFKPVGDLNTLLGKQQQGTWQLRITSVSPGNSGVLNSWGADEAPSVCTGNPVGSIVGSPNPAAPGTAVTFDGSGSRAPSPGATITDYKWNPDYVNTPNTWFDTGTTPSWTHTYSARGQYTVALKVTDSKGQTGTTTTSESITSAPVAAMSVSPGSPVAASPVTFDASASTHDPAGSIVDYKWDLDGSGNYAIDTGTTPRVTTTYPTARTVPVHVRITDDTGASAVAGQTVTVTDAPPIAAFSTPGPILVGQTISFNGSASHDADGTISDYRWDLTGSGTYGTDTGTNPSVSTSYSSPGTVTVGLRVTDNAGLTATTTHAIQVTRPPVARLTAAPNPSTAGQQVTLDASGSSDPDGVIANYRWDLDGSGAYATNGGATPFLVRAFGQPGTYRVGVLVTDNYGATASTTMTITVNPPSTGTSTGGGGVATPELGRPFGGNPSAGIASLSSSDLKTILPGSDNHFAAITGDPVRRGRAVAKGLWLNALSDRPANFQVSVAVSAADAQTLKLVKRSRGHRRHKAAQQSTVNVGSGSFDLSAAGQKPFAVTLTGRVAKALRRVRSGVKLLVTGTATDAAGHHTALARVFQVSR
jgi:subtilisin-like proprotein convertase family protein/PKD repeat protein